MTQPNDSVNPHTASAKTPGYMHWVVSGIVLAIAAAGGFLILGSSKDKSGELPAAAKPEAAKADPNVVKIDEKQKDSYSVQVADIKNFQAEQVCTGRIAFNDDMTTPVFAEYTGRVTHVYVKPGETVQQGAPLYEIDTPDLVTAETDLITAAANLRKAENALRLAESSKEISARNIDISNRNIDISKRSAEIATLSANLAKLNQDRQKSLVDDKAVAIKDYEQAQRDMQSALRDSQSAMRDTEQAKKDLEQAKKDQKQAESDIEGAKTDIVANQHLIIAIRDRLKQNFGKTDEGIDKLLHDRVVDRLVKVKSPISGTVTSRKIGLGQYIKPDNSDPLFTITELSSMWLVADVFEVDSPKIQLGQQVEVSLLAFPGEKFSAKVSYIGASVNPDTRRVPVRCTIPNDGLRLKAEMYASFRIQTGEGKPMPAVTLNAVVRDGNKDVVFVAKNDVTFEKRTVVTGLRQGALVQIVDGLKEGERVVSSGAIFLSNSDAN